MKSNKSKLVETFGEDLSSEITMMGGVGGPAGWDQDHYCTDCNAGMCCGGCECCKENLRFEFDAMHLETITRNVIRRLTEAFGEKIGDQHAGVGAADERKKRRSGPKVTDEVRAIDEVTPKSYEDVVMALKKEPEVKNPWAVAWSMKKKGIKPKK